MDPAAHRAAAYSGAHVDRRSAAFMVGVTGSLFRTFVRNPRYKDVL